MKMLIEGGTLSLLVLQGDAKLKAFPGHLEGDRELNVNPDYPMNRIVIVDNTTNESASEIRIIDSFNDANMGFVVYAGCMAVLQIRDRTITVIRRGD